MGASTVAMTAANYPGLLRCAILEDVPWRDGLRSVSAEGRAGGLARWRGWKMGDPIPTREEVIHYGQTQHPQLTEIEWGPWADSKLQLSPNVLAGLGGHRTPWQDIVARITCPILLITADTNLNAVVTPEVAEATASIWHDGEVVHISRAGHNIRREQFEKYVEAVTSFLERL